LEGPDGAGKTTLANRFQEAKFAYAHCGPPDRNAFDHWYDEVYANQGPVVFDRLHVGSYVYGSIFRGADDMSRFERWLFDGLMIAAGATMVYTRPPQEAMERAQGEGDRGPDAVYETRMAQVYRAYEDFFGATEDLIVGPNGTSQMVSNMTDIPTIWYDWTQHRSQDLVRAILTAHDDRMLARPFLHESVPAIGNVVNPRYVFVGEQPHTRVLLKRRATRRYPGRDQRTGRYAAWQRMCEIASGMRTSELVFDSSSGGYLATALMNSGLRLTDYCVFNSTLLDGRTVDQFMRRVPLGAEFVALGDVASHALDGMGLPHRRVPHPQHVRRFFYKRGMLEYPKVLLGEQDGNTLTWGRQ